PAIVIFSLFMAVLLNQKMMGRAVFRAIFFIPVILCTGLIDKIDASNTLSEYMQNTTSSIDTGSGTDTVNAIVNATDIQWMFSSMKVGTELVDYVVQIMNNIYDIINRSGVQMLIFLAGLQSVSPAIYESCDIDGASAWETFWKVTIPMVSPMILVNAVYTVIDALTSADNSVMSFISGVYNGAGGQELSSAMSWMYFMIVLALIGIVAAVLSAFIFYQRRD
ncbi:MAG: sugar ABC transporter permease, partial [Clostridia bacterium]|nr:sugar ABC transporter permease [Clostridia bacterium]